MKPVTLFTMGYGSWDAPRRLEGMLTALRAAGVTLLVDTRHSPCPSDAEGKTRYGPQPWHLLPGNDGITKHLADIGIRYRWLVELGNPQKRDPQMRVLHEHLGDSAGAWPVHRGLRLLEELVATEQCCLLCACADYDGCHRKVIAEAFRDRSPPGVVSLRDLARTRR